MVADVCQAPIDSLVRTRLDPVMAGILRDDLRPREIQDSFYFTTNALMRELTRCGHPDSVLASRVGKIATVADQTFTDRAVAAGYSPADLQRLGIRERLNNQREDALGDHRWPRDHPIISTWSTRYLTTGIVLSGIAGLAGIVAGISGLEVAVGGLKVAAGISLGLGAVLFISAVFLAPHLLEAFESAITDAKTEELQFSPDIVIDPQSAGSETFGKALGKLKADEDIAKS